MDSLSSLLQLLVRHWYLFLVVFIILLFRSPRGKGIWGEFKINLLTRFFLDKKIYHLIKNVTIPAGQGTTQIDHIIVSRYGVFVVETKNMRGWIFGGENQKSWTQKLYKHTATFQNPLRQNYKHTTALAELIGVEPKKIFSVIVFIGESTFKTPMPENVTQGMQYIHYIKDQQSVILGEHEVSELIDRIDERRLDQSRKTHRQHVEHLREQHSSPLNNQRPSPGKAIKIQVLTAFTVIAVGVALVFTLIQSEILKEFSGMLSSIIQKNPLSQQSQSKAPEPKEYTFSDDQVKRAMEEVLRRKIEEPPSANGVVTDQFEPMYQFEIELHTGVTIYTDNAEVDDGTVSYSSKNGLIISLDRAEIKTMKRVPKN